MVFNKFLGLMRFDSLFVFVDARAVIIVQGECNQVRSNCRAAADNVKEKHALRRRVCRLLNT